MTLATIFWVLQILNSNQTQVYGGEREKVKEGRKGDGREKERHCEKEERKERDGDRRQRTRKKEKEKRTENEGVRRGEEEER
jgi:hypothetical protein